MSARCSGRRKRVRRKKPKSIREQWRLFFDGCNSRGKPSVVISELLAPLLSRQNNKRQGNRVHDWQCFSNQVAAEVTRLRLLAACRLPLAEFQRGASRADGCDPSMRHVRGETCRHITSGLKQLKVGIVCQRSQSEWIAAHRARHSIRVNPLSVIGAPFPTVLFSDPLGPRKSRNHRGGES